MRYVFCVLLPPVAVATTGKPGAFIASIFLSLLFWIPGIIYAFMVVNKFYDDRRHKEAMASMKNNGVPVNIKNTINNNINTPSHTA